MEFIKRVSVLSEVLEGYSIAGKRASAILRIEIDNSVATMYLSTVNLKAVSQGEYHLFILDGNKKISDFNLGKRPLSLTKILSFLPEIENGFSAGICYIEEGLPSLLLFACEKGANIVDFKKAVADRCLDVRKNEIKEQEKIKPEDLNVDNGVENIGDLKPNDDILKKYNDEAVATENYYLKDENLKDKLKIFEVLDNESVRIKNELPVSPNEKETEKIFEDDFRLEDETNGSKSKEYSKDFPYINTARQELEDIFLKFPSEPDLEKNLANSRWARINYSFDKYYVVGVIKENGTEKYICYGIPAKYSKEPPKELKGFCSFIPVSIFDLNGDGYWMMFQDAITGECVKK